MLKGKVRNDRNIKPNLLLVETRYEFTHNTLYTDRKTEYEHKEG